MTELPVIDIAPLAGGDSDARRVTARELGQACRDIGFFYAVGHGVEAALITAAFAAAQRIFAMPEPDKEALSIRHSPHNRGYVGLGGERLDEISAPDLKEAFNIGLELAPDDPDLLAGRPFRGPNRWPAVPGLRETLLSYFDGCWSAGRLLHRGFALDLGMHEGFFDDKLDRPLATLRLLRYPPRSGAMGTDRLGAGQHTDYGNVTLLMTDGVPGLQVQRRDGTWIEAPHVPGAFVCNIGDCLMRWSNDVYVSTPHRVRQPERERLSLAFFLDPNPDAIVAALPGCSGPDRPPRYPPVSGADYLRQRLDATYDHRRTVMSESAASPD